MTAVDMEVLDLDDDDAQVPFVHLVPRSGNRKTGDIPVTYRPVSTCEPDCPFLPRDAAERFTQTGRRKSLVAADESGGCYGTGRIFGLASKFSQPQVPLATLRKALQKVSPTARFLRDRVVGDIVGDDGEADLGYIHAIARVARSANLIPFGYTHAWRRLSASQVRELTRSGYVMNASCETEDDVREAVLLGMPATITNDLLPEGATFVDADGRTLRLVTCPAQTREETTCASCGLCARPQRRSVVRFLIHGTARKAAARNVAARSAEPAALPKAA